MSVSRGSLLILCCYQSYDHFILGVEFKTRQVEIELRQLTFSIKLGEGKQGEVWYIRFVFISFNNAYLQTWKGLWSGHTVAIKKLYIKQGGYSMLDNFHQEYMKLRFVFTCDIFCVCI